MTLSGLQPWLRPYALHLLGLFPRLTVTSVYRSYTDQLRLWNNRANNPYPVAPPGRSFHELGRAFDAVAPIEYLRAAGAYWKRMGGTWSEHDTIHFQA